MAPKIKLDFSKVPSFVKIILAVIPAIIIIVIAFLVFILPKNKEIKDLETMIIAQESEIAKSQSKAEKLPELIAINEDLKNKLNELKKQLPEEREVTSLLKQVSDFAIKSGLKVDLWKPAKRTMHSSGIVFEIPVTVELLGSYHNLGHFFSNITSLNRIVNISNLRLSEKEIVGHNALLKINFTATTFSAVPEEEIGQQPATTATGRRGRRT
jgi:type IV pilus assembly protein PilO